MQPCVYEVPGLEYSEAIRKESAVIPNADTAFRCNPAAQRSNPSEDVPPCRRWEQVVSISDNEEDPKTLARENTSATGRAKEMAVGGLVEPGLHCSIAAAAAAAAA